MEDRSSEILAEFHAECQRVGVRIADISFDIAEALECLRGMPNNAGTSYFLQALDMHLLLLRRGVDRGSSTPWEPRGISDSRWEYEGLRTSRRCASSRSMKSIWSPTS